MGALWQVGSWQGRKAISLYINPVFWLQLWQLLWHPLLPLHDGWSPLCLSQWHISTQRQTKVSSCLNTNCDHYEIGDIKHRELMKSLKYDPCFFFCFSQLHLSKWMWRVFRPLVKNVKARQHKFDIIFIKDLLTTILKLLNMIRFLWCWRHAWSLPSFKI